MITSNAAVHADTIVVHPTAGDHSGLREAVAASSPGDTILVRAGVYPEEYSVAIYHDLVIIGDGPEVAMQDTRFGRGGISIFSGNTEVTGLRVGTVGVYQGASGLIHGNVIDGFVYVAGYAEVRQNLLTPENLATIYIDETFEGGTVERNIIWLPEWDDRRPGLWLEADVGDVVACNVIWNGYFSGGAFPIAEGENGNVFVDPLLCDPDFGDYDLTDDDHRLHEASPCRPGQHPLRTDCGRIGPRGVGCGGDAPFYAYRMTPSQIPYDRTTRIEIDGVSFPPGSSAALRAMDGTPIPTSVLASSDELIVVDVHGRGAPVGPYDLTIVHGEEASVLPNRFRVLPGSIAEAEPDTLLAASALDTVSVTGGPFLPGLHVELTDQGSTALPHTILSRDDDALVLEVRPGGTRGFVDLSVANTNGDVLTLERAIWVVDRNRELSMPFDHPTLQLAIDAAVEGDTIIVEDGVYPTNARVVSKNLCIRARNPGQAVLERQPTSTCCCWSILCLSGADERTLISGLVFRGGRAVFGGAINLEGSARIVGNEFVQNQAKFYDDFDDKYYGRGGAIWCNGAAFISNNTFVENAAGWGGGAVWAKADSGSPDSIRIVGNVFVDNADLAVRGADNAGSTLRVASGRVLIERNTIVHHETTAARVIVFSVNWYDDYPVVGRFTRNILSGSNPGGSGSFVLCTELTDLEFSCNVVHSQDLELICDDHQPVSLGVDPIFCDPPLDLTISVHSPVHPDSTACGQIGAMGVGCARTPIESDPTATAPVPRRYALGTPIPNPFSTRVRLPLSVPVADARVQVSVYDAQGRRVRALANAALNEGRYLVTWDSTDDGGRAVSSGVYFVRMQASTGERATSRAVLAR